MNKKKKNKTICLAQINTDLGLSLTERNKINTLLSIRLEEENKKIRLNDETSSAYREKIKRHKYIHDYFRSTVIALLIKIKL